MMLMMIGRFLGAIIALLLMLTSDGELMRMLIIRIRLTNDAVAAPWFRFYSRYASGGQERGMSEINGSISRCR